MMATENSKVIDLNVKKEDRILDFSDISTVGQGFVDEVFRVFKTKYSRTKIEYKNANDNVQFMIERGLN